MLDTDIVSYMLRGVGRAAEAIARRDPAELCMSAIALAELRYGAERRRSAKLYGEITDLRRVITVVPFDAACANEYGRIASELAFRGTPIGDFDTMIAAHAFTLDLTVVTNNVQHFSRVAGLRVENWA